MITDRDIAIRGVAERKDLDAPMREAVTPLADRWSSDLAHRIKLIDLEKCHD